jgi:hypothetical protein
MAAQVVMPQGLVRMMTKLPAIPGVPKIFQSVESVLPKFLPRISDVIPK